MKIKWDEWRGQEDAPTMLIKRLLWIPVWRRNGKWLSVRVDLHKMVSADHPGCYHTHPAYAVRIPFLGGYWEECISPFGGYCQVRLWEPGQIGIVRPSLCHRIAELAQVEGDSYKPSYSLWIRGPICADTQLRGEGWKSEIAQ